MDYGSRIFLIIAVVVLIIVFATLVSNAAYFGRIRRDGGTPQVNTASAYWLVWLNGLMAAVAGGLMLYAMVELFIHPTIIQAGVAYATAAPTGVVGLSPGGSLVTAFAPGSNLYTVPPLAPIPGTLPPARLPLLPPVPTMSSIGSLSPGLFQPGAPTVTSLSGLSL